MSLNTSSTTSDIVPFSAAWLKTLEAVTSGTVTLSGAVSGSGLVGSTISTTLSSGIDATKIADGTVSNTEFQYLNNVSSSIQTQLDGKVAANSAITGATKTKITYDSKGLVTAGADATTADIADSSNKRYVTDADLTKLGNLSGTNTGDQTITLSGAVTGSGTGAITTVMNSNLDSLTDVVLTSPSNGQVLGYNGTNWVNTTSGASGVTGSGTSGQVAYWSGSSAVSGDSGFTYDSTNDALTVNTAKIGSESGYAMFSHSSNFSLSSGTYSLLQDATGNTYLNCKDGQALHLRINNVDLIKLKNDATYGKLVGFGVEPEASVHIKTTTAVPNLRLDYDSSNYASISVSNANVVSFYANAGGGKFTFNKELEVPDSAYGAGWNGSTAVPTRNAVYDKIESLALGSGTVTSITTAYGLTGGTITTSGTIGIDTAVIPFLDSSNTFKSTGGQFFRQSTGGDGVLIKGGSTGSGSFSVELLPASLTSNRVITIPNVTGTLVTTADTGTVTSAMLSSSIDAAKIANGAVSNTEFQYLDGVTSAIQTQLNTKLQNNFTDTSGQFAFNGLRLRDVNSIGSWSLTVNNGNDLATADRTLTINCNDGNRTLSLSGNLTVSSTATVSGTNTGDQTITLTGDVTGSGAGSFATTIANDAVTYAKIQNVSATDRLLGRSSAGAGDIQEITCTAFGRSLIDDIDATTARTTLGLGTLATQSGTFSGTSSGTNTGDQNVFSTIAVAGQSNVVADSTSDTLTLVAGSNITLTTNATTDAITIAAAGGGGSMSIGGTVTSGTVGSVLFVGTGPTLQQDNTNFFWDNTNKRLGIGTATPDNDIQILSYAGSSEITLTRINGTSGSPTTLVNSDAIGGFNFTGRSSDGTVYTAAYMLATVDGTPSGSGMVTGINFATSNTGAPQVRMRLQKTGNLSIGTTTEATARVNILNTSEQLRLQYDTTNFASFTVGSTGITTINTAVAAANLTLQTGGVSFLQLRRNGGESRIDATGTQQIIMQGASTSGVLLFAQSTSGSIRITNDSGYIKEDYYTNGGGLIGTIGISATNDFYLSSGTGIRIATATTQKVGFFGIAPVVQQTNTVASPPAMVANTGTAVNDASTWDGYTIGEIVKCLRNYGLLA